MNFKTGIIVTLALAYLWAVAWLFEAHLPRGWEREWFGFPLWITVCLAGGALLFWGIAVSVTNRWDGSVAKSVEDDLRAGRL
jgi:uncharacterized membrane protein YhdT